MSSMKTLIAAAVKTKLSATSGISTVRFDDVKLATSDFLDEELPALQIIDVNMTSTPEKVRARKVWQLALELILRGDEGVNQSTLWDLENTVLRQLFSDPRLGIPGVISMNLLGSTTDLHLLAPFYYARIDVEITFYEGLVADC